MGTYILQITFHDLAICKQLNKCSLFSTLREPSENRKDLEALAFVGPPRDNPESDTLAVLYLDNHYK